MYTTYLQSTLLVRVRVCYKRIWTPVVGQVHTIARNQDITMTVLQWLFSVDRTLTAWQHTVHPMT